MQTFLPYPSYTSSAQVLDDKRLGKQRVECLQILQIIARKKGLLENPTGKKGFWNHPAVRMWEAYPTELCMYAYEILYEWEVRGFKDTVLPKIVVLDELFGIKNVSEDTYPPWLTPEFCRSHQSNLLRKYFAHYSEYFHQDIPNNLPYIWPV